MKFAPLDLFCAFAATSSGDPDLPDGIHLRLSLAPGLGPPIAPFLIWQTRVGPQVVSTGNGVLALPVDAAGLDTKRIVAIVATDPGGAPTTLVFVDSAQIPAEIARRSIAPAQLAVPAVQGARIDGGSAATQAGLVTVMADTFAYAVDTPPTALLPLAIGGICQWYAGGAVDQATAQAQGKTRLVRGAPKRQTPVDAPGGQPAALTPAQEMLRVRWQEEVDSRLEALLRTDPTRAPSTRLKQSSDPSSPGAPSIEIGIWDSLLLQTVDFGYARYAGLATTFDGAMPPVSAAGRTLLPGFWIAGLFALTPDALVETTPAGDGVPVSTTVKHVFPPDPAEQHLLDRFKTLVPTLGPVLTAAQAAGLQVRAGFTFCAAPTPADPPRAGTVALAGSTWIAQLGQPSTTFRQNFVFADQPLAATLAMAANTGPGGAFVPRTPPVDNSGGRWSPLLVGRLDSGVVTASDGNVPATPPPTYHFHAGDLFGRYGAASAIVAKPPDTPKPPLPVPQTVIVRSTPKAGSLDKLSPGTLNVTVPVPDITVLAAGARPIQTVTWSFDGQNGSIGVATPTAPATFSRPLPALAPLETASRDLQVTFVDAGASASDTATCTVTVTDSRAPQPVKGGVGLIWTSRPGPSPEVELNLCWQATPGHAYRCFLATGASLSAKGPTRAEAALAVVPGLLASRDVFQLITDPPVSAGPDGWVHLSTTLPRALRDIAFVKVVAISPGGVEADFAASGAVAVAVPRDLPPPPPRVYAAVNATGTGATVTVTATGLDLAALYAAEPGLKAVPPATSAKAPTARLRRAAGRVDDPLYARQVAGPVPMVVQPDGTFAVDIPPGASSPLVPFVRCTWWADVQMPDERELPSGVPAVTGDIRSDGGPGGPMPGLPSSLSAPFSTVPVPAEAPKPLPASAIQCGISPAGALPYGRVGFLKITGAPVASPLAIGAWRLRAWVRLAGQPLLQICDQATQPAPFSWSGTPMQPAVAHVFTVVLVDPLGRESAPTQVTATP